MPCVLLRRGLLVCCLRWGEHQGAAGCSPNGCSGCCTSSSLCGDRSGVGGQDWAQALAEGRSGQEGPEDSAQVWGGGPLPGQLVVVVSDSELPHPCQSLPRCLPLRLEGIWGTHHQNSPQASAKPRGGQGLPVLASPLPQCDGPWEAAVLPGAPGAMVPCGWGGEWEQRLCSSWGSGRPGCPPTSRTPQCWRFPLQLPPWLWGQHWESSAALPAPCSCKVIQGGQVQSD